MFGRLCACTWVWTGADAFGRTAVAASGCPTSDLLPNFGSYMYLHVHTCACCLSDPALLQLKYIRACIFHGRSWLLISSH